jgi:hypothetical protein
MRRLLWGGLLITATIAMSSCGSGQDEAVAPAVSASSSDLDTAARLYTGMTRTPADFLADPAPMSFAQVTTYHLKSRQLDAAATASHELCTDDWSEALAWSEAFAQQAPQYLDLVGNLETERYYEFDRVPRGVLDQYVRMRVYRCDYLDRDNVNLGSAGDFAGIVNHRPLDASVLAALSEYLWHFTEFNNAGHIVLASAPRAAASGLAHAITLASLERAESAGDCDRVVVHDWLHRLDPATGELRSSDVAQREFRVRRDGETITGC